MLRDLRDDYVERLLALTATRRAPSWPYSFAATASGIPLEPMICANSGTRLTRALTLTGAPFSPEGESDLPGLARRRRSRRAQGQPLSRYLVALTRRRSGAACALPRSTRGRPRRAARVGGRAGRARARQGCSRLGAARRRLRADLGCVGSRPASSLGAERGETVVCIPVYGAVDLLAECLASGARPHRSRGPDPDRGRRQPRSGGRCVAGGARGRGPARAIASSSTCASPRTSASPATSTPAFAAAAPADVVVLNSDCVVAAGWLEGMQRAAHSDALVATASALTNHGTILSVPYRNEPQPGLPQDRSLDDAAAAVLRNIAAASTRACRRRSGTACSCAARRSTSSAASTRVLARATARRSTSRSAACCTGSSTWPPTTCWSCIAAAGRSAPTAARTRSSAEHERIVESRYPYYQRTQTAAGEAGDGTLDARARRRPARAHWHHRDDRRALPRPDRDRHADPHARGDPGAQRDTAAWRCG